MNGECVGQCDRRPTGRTLDGRTIARESGMRAGEGSGGGLGWMGRVGDVGEIGNWGDWEMQRWSSGKQLEIRRDFEMIRLRNGKIELLGMLRNG